MDQKTNDNAERSKYHVPNLERGLKIIELLASHPEGLTTSQITERLDISRNSVFRITATLHDHGYLERDEESKVFQLSNKFLTVGYAALTEQTLVEKALEPMRALRDKLRETVPLGVLHGHEGLIIEEVAGLHPFRFVLEPGKQFLIHTSAPGKAMVAFLPAEEREELLSKIVFKKFNDRTIIDRKSFGKVLEDVRRNGYAVDCAEETEGMHCVGAPIFNRHGYPVAAIWITGPSSRIKVNDFPRIGKEVKRQADRISKSLGYGLTNGEFQL